MNVEEAVTRWVKEAIEADPRDWRGLNWAGAQCTEGYQYVGTQFWMYASNGQMIGCRPAWPLEKPLDKEEFKRDFTTAVLDNFPMWMDNYERYGSTLSPEQKARIEAEIEGLVLPGSQE
jgi:hypothetical protein